MGAEPCPSSVRPCTNIVAGKWRAAPGHKLVLTIPRVVEVTAGKTITLDLQGDVVAEDAQASRRERGADARFPCGVQRGQVRRR